MIRYIKSLLNHREQKPAKARDFARDWTKKSKLLLASLIKTKKKLEELQVELQTASMKLEQQVQEAEQLERQHETVVAALESENTVMKEITIPALLANGALVTQRLEEDMSLSVMRQTASKIRQHGDPTE